jgi:hypothetical protein
VHKLHVIEHYIAIKNEIISRQRYDLSKNIRTLALKDNLLYVFYESSDSLDTIIIREEGIAKVWTHHWVDLGTQDVFPFREHLFLRGASYVKNIRLGNWEAMSGRMAGKE